MNNAISPNYFELSTDETIVNIINTLAPKFGTWTAEEQTLLAVAVVEGKERGIRAAFEPVGFNTSMVADSNAKAYSA